MDNNTKNSQDPKIGDVDAANSELMQAQAEEATEDAESNPVIPSASEESVEVSPETDSSPSTTHSSSGSQNDNSNNPFAALKEEAGLENSEDSDQSEDQKISEPEVSEIAVSDTSDQTDSSGTPRPSESSEKEQSEETETVEEPKTEEEPEKPEPPSNPKARWYVVHTFAGHENKVAAALRQRIEAEHLENLIFDILVPTQDKIEIKGGKKETVKEKIFPGYILIKMELSDLSWLAVRTTQGVTSFIGAGNKPTPISEAEVATIVKFTTQGASPTFKDVFMVDDTVKIVDGPFAEFIGKVDSVDKEKGRVRVLVSIFGRETPVELDFLQVQKL